MPPNKKIKNSNDKGKQTEFSRHGQREILEDKGIFYNNSDSDNRTHDNESSSDGDEDEQEKVYESFNNNSLKIVSPLLLQELINDFAVCKHCGGKLLLCEDMVSSHGRMQKFECETDSCESNKLYIQTNHTKKKPFL